MHIPAEPPALQPCTLRGRLVFSEGRGKGAARSSGGRQNFAKKCERMGLTLSKRLCSGRVLAPSNIRPATKFRCALARALPDFNHLPLFVVSLPATASSRVLVNIVACLCLYYSGVGYLISASLHLV